MHYILFGQFIIQLSIYLHSFRFVLSRFLNSNNNDESKRSVATLDVLSFIIIMTNDEETINFSTHWHTRFQVPIRYNGMCREDVQNFSSSTEFLIFMRHIKGTQVLTILFSCSRQQRCYSRFLHVFASRNDLLWAPLLISVLTFQQFLP